MARQGFARQLMRYDDRGWRATFCTTGMEHSPTSATSAARERAPWHTARRACLEHIEGTLKGIGVADSFDLTAIAASFIASAAGR
jgi:hypothetical protein